MDSGQIDQVRRFNRAVTRRVGALDDSYLSRGRPLGEARLLFEVGPEGEDVGALRARLGLDSGYMSRLLRSLEAQGLLTVERQDHDGRGRRAVLTETGRIEHAAYDGLSDDLARQILTPLSAAERDRLVAAMAEVERLLGAAAISVDIEPPETADARQCLASYFTELNDRFEAGFDPSRGKPHDERNYAPPAGYFVLARIDGRPAGCGALSVIDPATVEIKRMWTAPHARGQGVARRILRRLEEIAASTGATRILLDTNRSLKEAQAMYRREGYAATDRYNDNPYADFWFEKRLA